MEPLERLISRRSNFKGRMTRIYNFLDNQENTEKIFEIQIRQAELVELYKKYNNVQDDIELLEEEKPERKALHEAERSATEEKYYEHQALIAEMLKNDQNQSDASYHSFRRQTSKHTNIKIPSLQIPNFDGSLKEWSNFKTLFDGVIDANEQFTALQKLQYLKSLLRGEAAGLINSISINGDNYRRALDILVNRCAKNVQFALGFLCSVQVYEGVVLVMMGLIKFVTVERNMIYLFGNFGFIACCIQLTGAYMLPAGDITHEASLVSTAMFHSGWELVSSRRLRALLVLALQRSQVPVYLTAFGMITLSYASFITVIRSSYSFFAVMY